MTARARVSSATIYVDAVAGSDANDGTTPATALKTIQRAFDYASGNFDICPPFTWTPGPGTYIGERAPIVIQMAPAPAATPYVLPQPAYLDGYGLTAPVLLRGDPANPTDYFIRSNSTFQGLTAQNGARLICDGFAIVGVNDCTLINGLTEGSIRIRNVWFGQVAAQALGHGACPLGAAGGSQVEIDGPITMWGAGNFAATLSAIEDGRLILAPGHSINFQNAMDFGVMFGLMHASCWTMGSPPVFGGPGLAGCTGQKYSASCQAFLGFNHTLIPGTGGFSDATSTVL